MDKIAVLIPCYNEEKTIAKVVADAKAALPEAVIYVYDNNSTDRTVELAREAGAVIRHEYMQGKAMSSAGCSGKWKPAAISWWTGMIPIPWNSHRKW